MYTSEQQMILDAIDNNSERELFIMLGEASFKEQIKQVCNSDKSDADKYTELKNILIDFKLYDPTT